MSEPFKCRYCYCTFFDEVGYKAHLRKYNPNVNQLVNLTEEQKERIVAREHLENWLRDVAGRKSGK